MYNKLQSYFLGGRVGHRCDNVHSAVWLPSLLQPHKQPGGVVRPDPVRLVRVQLPRLGLHLLPRQGVGVLVPRGGPATAILGQRDPAAPLDPRQTDREANTRLLMILLRTTRSTRYRLGSLQRNLYKARYMYVYSYYNASLQNWSSTRRYRMIRPNAFGCLV